MSSPSTKPYLIRAIHEWCMDAGFTPYLAVRVDEYTRVPREYVKNGEIVLNVSLDATHQFVIGNEDITFQARFNGKAFPVRVPIQRVVGIFARENSEGLAFELEETPVASSDTANENDDTGVTSAKPGEGKPGDKPSGRPTLTRVK